MYSWVSSTFIILSLLLFWRLNAQVKETHQIIKEWVQTKQLISKENANWETEKIILTDLDDSLTKEISELENKLELFEKENIGATQQRADLSDRKEKTEITSLLFYDKMKKVETEINKISGFIPSPLKTRLSPFFEKINTQRGKNYSLRDRLDAAVSILQSIHLFNREVHLERQEFSLDEGKSREFRVLYFGLSVAYFVNESESVAGWGQPSEKGWIWTRKDGIAKEISSGVAILENRALPRFLKLPIPIPVSTER